MNPYEEMREVVTRAKQTIEAADRVANDVAGLLRGRLHKVCDYNLKQLKRELRDYNIHTGTWRAK